MKEVSIRIIVSLVKNLICFHRESWSNIIKVQLPGPLSEETIFF